MNATVNIGGEGPAVQRSFRRRGNQGGIQQQQQGTQIRVNPPGYGQSRSARRRRRRRQAANNNGGARQVVSQPLGQQNVGFANARSRNRNRQANRVASSINRGMVSGEPLSSGLPSYLACVLDPATAQPARIPTTFPFPTAVMRLRYSGYMSPNADGNCIIALRNGGGSNASPFVFTSMDPNYTKIGNWIAIGGGHDRHYGEVEDYLAIQAYSGFRTVGASLKVHYVGPNETMSGEYVACFTPGGPQHILFNPDHMREQFFSKRVPITKEGIEVIYVPREDIDYDFREPDTDAITSFCEVACLGSFNGTADTIAWEAVVHIEYIPTRTNYEAHKELIESDIRTKDVLQRVVNENPSYVVSKPSEDQVSAAIKNKIGEMMFGSQSFMSPAHIADVATETVKDWLQSGAGMVGSVKYSETPWLAG